MFLFSTRKYKISVVNMKWTCSVDIFVLMMKNILIYLTMFQYRVYNFPRVSPARAVFPWTTWSTCWRWLAWTCPTTRWGTFSPISRRTTELTGKCSQKTSLKRWFFEYILSCFALRQIGTLHLLIIMSFPCSLFPSKWITESAILCWKHLDIYSRYWN